MSEMRGHLYCFNAERREKHEPEQVRGVLPGPEQVRGSAQHLATRVSHLASDAKGTTEQAMNKVKQTGSDLAEKAKQLTAVGNHDRR